jgi:hypothetical protein
MSTSIDLTGHQYGRWLVKQRAGSDKHGNAAWACVCECGTRKIVSAMYLRSGHSQSRGCLLREKVRVNGKKNARHGHCRRHQGIQAPSPTYHIWAHVHQRFDCCARWSGADGFAHFLTDMGERPRGSLLGRINCNREYGPRNCKWAWPTQLVRRRVTVRGWANEIAK